MYTYDIEELVKFCKDIKVLFSARDTEERKSILEVFEIFFNNITVVGDGHEAYKHFINNKYDLIITGIDMPLLNGLDLVKKIREVSNHKSILVISSKDDKNQFVELITQGIDGYILKPVDFEQFSTILHRTIEKIKDREELFQYRVNLEKKVQAEVKSRLHVEEILAHQSKLASMGEMMDAVAHQWKQPLNNMSMYVDYMEILCEEKELNIETIHELHDKYIVQKEHMLNTLQEFRDFFRPNTTTEKFLIGTCIKSVLLLVKDEFIKNKIEVFADLKQGFYITGIINEFKHVILNIINNSKDAFIENNVEKKHIHIKVNQTEQYNEIVIEDNAGGIPEHVIENIFKANVTTKQKGKGTGIGLYMTQQIVEKVMGQISVENYMYDETQKGARFIIKLPVQ